MRFHVCGCSAIDFGKLKGRRRGCVQMWKRPQEPLLSVLFLEKSRVQEALLAWGCSLTWEGLYSEAVTEGGSHWFIL